MRIASSVVAAAVAVLLLAGCVPERPEVTPVPEPSSTPVFASDEDALAAAEAAYAAYLAVSDAISADGGANPERIQPLVSPDKLDESLDSFSAFSENNLHTTGSSNYDNVTLAQYADYGAGLANVDVYVCLDISSVRVLDESNDDVTPVDRRDRLPLLVSFVVEAPPRHNLILTGSDSWTGTDFC